MEADYIKKGSTMKTYTLYKHTLPDGKIYIGCTSRKPEERWQGGHGYYNNKRFYDAILFYGWNNIGHEVIAENLERNAAYQLEHELIVAHQSNNPEFGYNVSSGFGKTGCIVKHSEETLAKISEGRKGKAAGAKHPMARPVYCVELDTVFDYAKQAEEITGVCRAHICQVCKGQRKRAGKMHWEYASN